MAEFVFVPDDVLAMCAQEPSREILSAFAGTPASVIEYIVAVSRLGAPLCDEADSERTAWINEGRRQMALELLAVRRCASMGQAELDELIAARGFKKEDVADDHGNGTT